jgi:hypothetical protein
MSDLTEKWGDVVNVLIQIGMTPRCLNQHEQYIRDKFYSWPHFKIWDELTENLSIEEHEFLGKGFAYWAKNNPIDGGSVTPLIGIYRSYEKKYPTRAHDFANWILENSDNQWAPFGYSREVKRQRWR